MAKGPKWESVKDSKVSGKSKTQPILQVFNLYLFTSAETNSIFANCVWEKGNIPSDFQVCNIPDSLSILAGWYGLSIFLSKRDWRLNLQICVYTIFRQVLIKVKPLLKISDLSKKPFLEQDLFWSRQGIQSINCSFMYKVGTKKDLIGKEDHTVSWLKKQQVHE